MIEWLNMQLQVFIYYHVLELYFIGAGLWLGFKYFLDVQLLLCVYKCF